jgi:hypothetical protein
VQLCSRLLGCREIGIPLDFLHFLFGLDVLLPRSMKIMPSDVYSNFLDEIISLFQFGIARVSQ